MKKSFQTLHAIRTLETKKKTTHERLNDDRVDKQQRAAGFCFAEAEWAVSLLSARKTPPTVAPPAPLLPLTALIIARCLEEEVM